MSEPWPRRVRDPDGREVVFDGAAHLHLVRRKRAALLDQVDAILETVARPDFREQDPIPGRERFYRQDFNSLGTWLLVVVDFSESPGWIVNVLISYSDPRGRRQ